eukprot:60902-Pleurochrysis_carterae.AAC.1
MLRALSPLCRCRTKPRNLPEPAPRHAQRHGGLGPEPGRHHQEQVRRRQGAQADRTRPGSCARTRSRPPAGSAHTAICATCTQARFKRDGGHNAQGAPAMLPLLFFYHSITPALCLSTLGTTAA